MSTGDMDIDGTMDLAYAGMVTGNGTIYAGSCKNNNCPPFSTLPVKLLFFQSKVVTGKVQLDWATSMEENFDYFTLERAGEDGNFEAIAKIEGKSFSTEEVH